MNYLEDARFCAQQILTTPGLLIGVTTLIGFIYGAFFMDPIQF